MKIQSIVPADVLKKLTESSGAKKEQSTNDEIHFTSGKELVDHIRSGKKAWRGDGSGWISIDRKDPSMVVSFRFDRDAGRNVMEFETLEAFKGYAALLDRQKKAGHIPFWHKKRNGK